jgi:hypothetical protein
MADHKAKKGSSNESNFAKEVVQSAEIQKFCWDFLEADFLSRPSTQKVIADAEALGWSGDRFVDMILARAALRPEQEKRGGLSEIFHMCGLDPRKPFHWRALLNALVEVGFKNAGAPEEWDDLSYYQLVCDIGELQKLRPNLKTHSEITRRLQDTRPFKHRYERWGFGYFRKRVSEARKMQPADSFEQFIVQRREGKFDLPAGFAQAYIERASAKVAAENEFDPDAADALIEEAMKIVGLKRQNRA